MVLLAYKARASIGHRFATRSFGSVRSLHLGIVRTTTISRSSPRFMCRRSGVICSSRFITEFRDFQYLVQLVVVVCFVCFSISFPSSYISMKFDVFHPRRPLGLGYMTVSMVHVSCDLDMAWTSWCASKFIIHSPLGDCAVGVWLLFDM